MLLKNAEKEVGKNAGIKHYRQMHIRAFSYSVSLTKDRGAKLSA